MGSIGRYMFRTTMGAFVITLVSLTVVMWFTQAMREFDLITSQRQTLLVFVGITGLLIPLLVMMIAPIALVLAAAHVLNKLSTDCEIIVMNAAGISPWRLLRPSWRRVSWCRSSLRRLAAYISPLEPARVARLGHPGARQHSHQYRAARPLHHHRRQSHLPHRRPAGPTASWSASSSTTGAIPNERATYLAEQGEIVKNDNGSFLVLENGSVQRLEAGQRDPRIVTFDRYAFDLSKFTGRPAERDLQHAREISLGAALAAGRRSALRRAARLNIAPNCTTGLRRRSIRSPSSSSPSPSSGRRKPPGKAARWRCSALIGCGVAAAPDRLPQRHFRRARAGRSRRAICRAVRRDRRRIVADFARPSDRARRRCCRRSPPRSANASHERRRVEERPMIAGTLSRYFGLRFLIASSARSSAWSRSPR